MSLDFQKAILEEAEILIKAGKNTAGDGLAWINFSRRFNKSHTKIRDKYLKMLKLSKKALKKIRNHNKIIYDDPSETESDNENESLRKTPRKALINSNIPDIYQDMPPLLSEMRQDLMDDYQKKHEIELKSITEMSTDALEELFKETNTDNREELFNFTTEQHRKTLNHLRSISEDSVKRRYNNKDIIY